MKKIHFLIRMSRDPDFYEQHRHNFFSALLNEKHERKRRPHRKRAKSHEEAEADRKALEQLERHKAKVAKIIIERPYLENTQGESTSIQDDPTGSGGAPMDAS